VGRTPSGMGEAGVTPSVAGTLMGASPLVICRWRARSDDLWPVSRPKRRNKSRFPMRSCGMATPESTTPPRAGIRSPNVCFCAVRGLTFLTWFNPRPPITFSPFSTQRMSVGCLTRREAHPLCLCRPSPCEVKRQSPSSSISHDLVAHKPPQLLQLPPGAVEQVGHGQLPTVGGGQVGSAEQDVADVASR